MNKRLISTALLASAAFANAAPAATPPVKGKGGAPKAEDRIAPVFTTVRADVKMPESVRRGQKSALSVELAKLEVGQSIGLMNKTKEQISSSVSKENNRKENQRQQTDAAGNPMTKPGEPIKDAAGQIVSPGQPVPVMERIKEFVAHTVDPKKDPDKATVRIFRTK